MLVNPSASSDGGDSDGPTGPSGYSFDARVSMTDNGTMGPNVISLPLSTVVYILVDADEGPAGQFSSE